MIRAKFINPSLSLSLSLSHVERNISESLAQGQRYLIGGRNEGNTLHLTLLHVLSTSARQLLHRPATNKQVTYT